MRFFAGAERQCLGYEVTTMAIVFVIVRPAVNFWYFAHPVAMTRFNWRGPLKSSRTPWIQCSHLAALPDAYEEIEYKQQLGKEYYHCDDADKGVEALEVLERFPGRIVVVTAGHTCDTFVVHRPENKVCTYECDEEVDIPECIVHELAEHLREPMIYTREHTEEC